MPKISIIVPVYNVEQYLDRCIESIVSQTFDDFELILIDDGSPDNCPKMCDEWAKKDSRIHVIHQENGGLSAARNAGIDWAFANSNSEWLTFIDSDDWVHEKYLELLHKATTKNNVNVGVAFFQRTNGTTIVNTIIDEHFVLSTPEDFYVNNQVNFTIACGKLYSKHSFKEIRYPVGKLHEDEYTTYKILFKETSIAVIEFPLYMYFQNEFGIMNSKWNPSHLDKVDALYEQSDYLSKNNYEKALLRCERLYLHFFREELISLDKSALSWISKRKFKRIYVHQLKEFIKKRHNNYTYKTIPWHYSFLFPKRMFLLWSIKGLIHKHRP